LFFKDTQTITISSADTGAGVDKVYYVLSDTILDESEVSKITGWTEYTSSFTVEPDNQYIVYVKITDKAGNSAYISSDGLVLDGTPPAISGAENGKGYCGALDIQVTDENLDVVTVDGVATELIDGMLTLSPTGKSQTIVVTDKAGNTTTLSVTIYSSHEWDKGIVTSAPTVNEKGIKTYTCTHCGETRIEEIERLALAIIEGHNNEWKPSKNSTPLTFRSNAMFKDFIRVLVNGEEIDPKHYTLREGSIIVTLKPEYLATLPAGKYTLGIHSVTGIATTEFTIATKADDNSGLPQTGDNSNMLLWIGLLLVSCCVLAIFGIKSRKRKTVK